MQYRSNPCSERDYVSKSSSIDRIPSYSLFPLARFDHGPLWAYPLGMLILELLTKVSVLPISFHQPSHLHLLVWIFHDDMLEDMSVHGFV